MKNTHNGTPIGQQVLKTAQLPLNNCSWDETKSGIDGLFVTSDEKPIQTEDVSYWLFLPENDSEKNEQGYPLLLFLHGAGERGSDAEKVTVHGPPKILKTDQAKDWPFVTVSPQCAEKKLWSPSQMFALIDEIEANYPIDPQRIYVTGLSMGGFGTWKMLLLDGDRIAAAAPICGGVELTDENIAKLVNAPVWIFHGGSDPDVPTHFSVDAEAALKDAGSTQVKLTIYPGVGHDSWNNAYADPELYRWLLSHVNDKAQPKDK